MPVAAMRIVFMLLPLLAAISVIAFRERMGVRCLAIALIFIALIPVSGVLIAPHRIASELIRQSPQSEEWNHGARATRDAVYQVLPILALSLSSLVALALIPVSKKTNESQINTRHSVDDRSS
jgi:hypothetical protein